MENLIKDFLEQKKFAVVGSFRNETKYAYKIFKELTARGYEVYPVNPQISEVEGVRCYGHISDLPFAVDVVDIVTPPPVTETVLKECLQKGIRRVWLQPGAESEKAIKFCQENNIQVVYNTCVMLEIL